MLYSRDLLFFKRFYLFIFRERRREGMCPDWESNQRPFGSQAHAQSIELHHPGYIVEI